MFENPLLRFRQWVASVHEELFFGWVAIDTTVANGMKQSLVLREEKKSSLDVLFVKKNRTLHFHAVVKKHLSLNY